MVTRGPIGWFLPAKVQDIQHAENIPNVKNSKETDNSSQPLSI